MHDEELTTRIDQTARVLQQLKYEVREQRRHRASAGMPTQFPATPTERPATLDRVHASKQVNPHLPIAWPSWPRGIWPKIVAACQKVARRLLRWYINPIVEQQNRHNEAVAQALDTLWVEIAGLRQASGDVPSHDDSVNG